MAEELAGAWQRCRDYLALLARLQVPARLRASWMRPTWSSRHCSKRIRPAHGWRQWMSPHSKHWCHPTLDHNRR